MEGLPEELTEDEYELTVLRLAEEPLDPADPYQLEMHDFAVLLQGHRRAMTAKQRLVLPMIHAGLSDAEISRRTGVTTQTISKARDNPEVKGALTLLLKADLLRRGPELEARQAMLWRIAKREENKKPTVTIRALEVLDKQQGIYKDESDTGDMVVNIQNFIVNKSTDTPEREVNPKNPAFKPMRVNVDG